MAIIRKDDIGLFCWSGGYIARPIHTSKLQEGEKHRAYHHGGSIYQTVGEESWFNCGNRDCSTEDKQRLYKWYRKRVDFDIKHTSG